jgi:ATP-dependent Clp protease ATP-binding subunit ClpC
MYERYTESCRRVIFFARYEASNYGSQYIETEHLLLGLLREDWALLKQVAREHVKVSEIRAEIEKRITQGERISTSVEVPLSSETKRILYLAAESADRLGHRAIETKHLLLGILGIRDCLAAQILTTRVLKPGSLLEEIESAPPPLRFGEVTGRGRIRLELFLSGLKSMKSDELMDHFAERAEFIDISGRRCSRDEISKEFDALFAPYAKKNASYTVETTLAETRVLFVATILWKNAILASEERIWMHRMTATLIIEATEWKILLLQVTGVQPPLVSYK